MIPIKDKYKKNNNNLIFLNIYINFILISVALYGNYSDHSFYK